MAEAVAHFRAGIAALEQLQETPDRVGQEIDLRLSLGVAEFWAGRSSSAEFESNYARARSCCESLADDRRLFPALWELWQSRQHAMKYDSASKISEELLVLSKDSDDPATRLQAHHAAWTTQFCIGAPREALGHADAGIEIYDPQLHHVDYYIYGGHDAGVCGRAVAAMSAWLTGLPARASRLADDALGLADSLEALPSRLQSRWHGAIVAQFRDEPKKCARLSAHCVALGEEYGMSASPPVVRSQILRGWAATRLDEEAGMLATMQSALDSPAANLFRPYYTYLLADAQARLGMQADALDTLSDALSYVHEIGEPWWEAEIRRLEGELLLRREHGYEAGEASLVRALETAAKQGAKALELRAATSLARLWGYHGKRREALDLLDPVFGQFTEGFDSPDLVRARSLLAELSRSHVRSAFR